LTERDLSHGHNLLSNVQTIYQQLFSAIPSTNP
jgi:hypothetical protein